MVAVEAIEAAVAGDAEAAAGSPVIVRAPSEISGFQRSRLSNGVTVVSEFMPGVRSVAIGAWVRAASVHEPRELMGVSHLLEHMVFKGTTRRSAKEIAMSLENLGGSLDAYTARDHTAFQARVLDEHLHQAADILGDLVFNPLLRESDLALERRVVLEEIAMVDDTPDDLVFELHNELMWGDHPYGYSILGTRATVASLGAGDLRALHERGYQPQHLVVAASGHVHHDELLEALTRTGWADVPRGEAPLAVSPPPTGAPPMVRHVAREAAQTQIVLGSSTVPYGDPMRYPMTLASLLLGGGMSSRLFQRVREELGLAYSVYSFHSYHADSGIHGIHVATSPENAGVALEAVRGELARVADEGFTEEEIEAGKGQLKGQVTLSLESASARMYRAAATELYDEPYRPLDEVLSQIDSIRAQDVGLAAHTYLTPDCQTVLSLGPTHELTGPGLVV